MSKKCSASGKNNRSQKKNNTFGERGYHEDGSNFKVGGCSAIYSRSPVGGHVGIPTNLDISLSYDASFNVYTQNGYTYFQRSLTGLGNPSLGDEEYSDGYMYFDWLAQAYMCYNVSHVDVMLELSCEDDDPKQVVLVPYNRDYSSFLVDKDSVCRMMTDPLSEVRRYNKRGSLVIKRRYSMKDVSGVSYYFDDTRFAGYPGFDPERPMYLVAGFVSSSDSCIEVRLRLVAHVHFIGPMPYQAGEFVPNIRFPRFLESRAPSSGEYEACRSGSTVNDNIGRSNTGSTNIVSDGRSVEPSAPYCDDFKDQLVVSLLTKDDFN
jgi:hypothetical protein